MATKTFDELKQLAIQIRDEKTNKQNTANRVGTAMLEGINKLEQDYYDKTAADEEFKKRDDKLIELANNVGLYNVDKHVPLGGGFYTSATARAAVPSDVRKVGLIITYKTDATTSVTEQFIGSDVSGWTTDANWKNVGSEGGNKILEWKTDAATTRKKVPVKERKAGMQISYKPTDSDWVNEQYVGTSFTDTEWVKDSNWEKIPKQKQLIELGKRTGRGITLLDRYKSKLGYALDNEGNLVSAGGWISYNKIPVAKGDNFTAYFKTLITSETKVQVAIFNSDKTLIHSIKNNVNVDYTITEDGFLSFCYLNTDVETWYVLNTFKDLSDRINNLEEKSLLSEDYNEEETDLVFSDENGLEIMRLAKGHIKTKNFDSSLPNKDSAGIGAGRRGDFSIEDENGNTIAYFKDGHIKTKNFDSSKLKDVVDLEFEEEYFFKVEVNTRRLFKNNNTTPQQPVDLTDVKQYDEDYCYCKLPKGHTKLAKPLKVILMFHGGGYPVHEDSSAIMTEVMPHYLVACGYALVMSNGMPKKLSDDNGLDYARPVGNWMAIESATKALQYACDNFNLDINEVYVMGYSQGGQTAFNFAECGNVRVRALALDCPCTSIKYHQINLVPRNVEYFYGFNSEETYDKLKCYGLEPYTRACTEVEEKENFTLNGNILTEEDYNKITSRRTLRVPTKFFLASRDATVAHWVNQVIVKQCQNNGQYCEVHLQDTNQHCITVSGAKWDGNNLNAGTVPIALMGVAEWFSRFGGYKTIVY